MREKTVAEMISRPCRKGGRRISRCFKITAKPVQFCGGAGKIKAFYSMSTSSPAINFDLALAQYLGDLDFPKHPIDTAARAVLDLAVYPMLKGDFTIYVPAKEFRAAIERVLPSGVSGAQNRHFDLQCEVDFSSQARIAPPQPSKFSGRVHAALCNSGNTYSVTFRGDGKETDFNHDHAFPDRDPANSEALVARFVLPTTNCAYAKDLFEVLLAPQSASEAWKSRGLILIAGRTGSGKTHCLNGLLGQHVEAILQNMESQKRRPHVVVLGDPIETLFFSARGRMGTLADSYIGQKNQPHPTLDFTGRELGIDVASVKDGLEDALRETPCAVVVSELRDKRDFLAALAFASTGHLIFATSHNSSLVDVFRKLLDVSEAKTASDRSSLVQCLNTIIHIENVEGEFLPALWRSGSQVRRNFVSEGLSSILPSSRIKPSEECGIVGRLGMFDKLVEWKVAKSKDQEKQKKIREIALQMDLAGI
jgi:hypothetical protein